jgi:crotonobetainyl-CoA:carnitine CoA-transferase CaiB-like acyl-CoA transferase
MSETGALGGVKVIELASDQAALAGKMMADLGADVIVVEPPGGHASRTYGPFVDDQRGPERSLWWWYYNTSKRSVVIDLDTPDGAEQFRKLAAGADIVLEGTRPGYLAGLGIDYDSVRAASPTVIWVALTPFGRTTSRADEEATDLTLLAGSGPVWNCGYDDHTLPPVRGGGNQAFHMGSVWACMSALTALVHRDLTGVGQFADVSMHAAGNVTTESGSFQWLVAQATVQRQTGRHALTMKSMEVQTLAADDRYVTTGFLPHEAHDLQAILDWMDELGLRDEFPGAPLLELGIEKGGIDPRAGMDVEGQAILEACRESLFFIASRISAYDFFVGTQSRDMQCGVVYAPEEAYEDPHFKERGFQVHVHHDELDRDVRYPGAPFKLSATPWRISRRPPLVGEHTAEIIGSLA